MQPGDYTDRARDPDGNITWKESDFFKEDEPIFEPGELELIDDVDYISMKVTSNFKKQMLFIRLIKVIGDLEIKK